MYLCVALSFSEDCADTRISSSQLTTITYSMSRTSLPPILAAPPTSASPHHVSHLPAGLNLILLQAVETRRQVPCQCRRLPQSFRSQVAPTPHHAALFVNTTAASTADASSACQPRRASSPPSHAPPEAPTPCGQRAGRYNTERRQ